MINAVDANKKTEKVLFSKNEKVFTEIFYIIEQSINQGDYNHDFRVIVDKLKDLGYYVKEICNVVNHTKFNAEHFKLNSENSYSIIINWGNKNQWGVPYE